MLILTYKLPLKIHKERAETGTDAVGLIENGQIVSKIPKYSRRRIHPVQPNLPDANDQEITIN